MSLDAPKPRQFLSADGLLDVLRKRFDLVPDPRRADSAVYPLPDVLMAAFAMFLLKDPSLLAFQNREDDRAIQSLFHLPAVPSDSQMREILDPVEIEQLNECFVDLFYELQRGGVLREYVFDEGYYLVAIDGTGHFCSSKIRCDHCLERTTRGGQTQYHHQAVVATLIHPNHRETFPLALEPIVKQDGETKNDCERNATRRLLQRLRRQHPKLKIIIVEDGLSSNGPHIRDLQALGFSFLLGAKPGDHAHLFEHLAQATERQEVETLTTNGVGGRVAHTRYARQLSLNATHGDLLVNVLEHLEHDAAGQLLLRFSWVTDRELIPDRRPHYVRGGRSRWRIENETFNTLKNQGYHLEHNYGHGKVRLCTVLATLMLLAFLVDQIQQACCPLFRAVLAQLGSRRELWDQLRSHFRHFMFTSFRQLWTTVLTGAGRNRPPPLRA